MANTPLVSIVIPVYNRERYVGITLDSVIKQSYTNLEIIVVNDGSTDRSLEIIETISLSDKRIIIVNKKNEGLPSARKSGVDIATGDYVFHLDADDILDKYAIEKLVYRALETGADVVTAKFVTRYKDGDVEYKGEYFDEMSSVDYLKLMLSHKAFFCVWIRLHKRKLYLDNDIVFHKEVSFGEDALLMTQIFFYSQKVAFLDYNVIVYNRTEDSITQLDNISSKRLNELHRFPEIIDSFLQSKGVREKFDLECGYIYVFNMIDLISYKLYDYVLSDMNKAVYYVKKYPQIKKDIHRRFAKLITFFSISQWLGLWYFKKKFGVYPSFLS